LGFPLVMRTIWYMAEPSPIDELLSDAIRYLIAGGLALEIVEKDGQQTYMVDGQEVTGEQLIAGAYLLGMSGPQPVN
jgi:hypothetical protein